MIRLATCFSGIGAIEHALNRMGLDNKIVFACDNGDVDILTKDVAVDIEVINEEIEKIKNIIQMAVPHEEQCSMKEELKKDISLLEQKQEIIDALDGDIVGRVSHVLSSIRAMKNINKRKKNEYGKSFEMLSNLKNNDRNSRLYALIYALKLISDFQKDNNKLESKEMYSASFCIDWQSLKKDIDYIQDYMNVVDGKKIIKGIRDVCERLGMLHEQIRKFEIDYSLKSLPTYDDKKAYIDELYSSKSAQNKVRQSYMANYDIDERNFHWNVSFLDGGEYAGKVDLFVGGSPCQSFSLVGKQRGLEDTRGTLFYEYARLVREIQPKVFIYENVKAVLSNDDGNTWKTMSSIFSQLGYTWSYQVLNAKDYGIPQNRERIFVVGFRNDLQLKEKFSFPEPIKLKYTMRDFLLDNVSGKYYLPAKGVDFVTSDKNLTKRYTQIDGDIALCQKKNQQFNWHGDFVFEEENRDKEKFMQDVEKYFLSEKVRKYVLASGTKNFYTKPQTDLDIARPLLTTMHKMHRAGVDNYVTTDGRLRKLTPRECLRLMGFSDSFKIVVSDTAMYQQAGNSIVVDVLMNIMKQVIKAYPNLLEE